FDTAKAESGAQPLGVLGTRRKPFQDSPTPAGNSVAAIALLRLHAYTNNQGYYDRAKQTIEVLAGVGGRYGLFAATYGIAGVHLSQPHTQVVVIGHGEAALQLYSSAVKSFSVSKAVLKLSYEQAVTQNLPPALAETIPQLPAIQEGRATAVICSGFSCQPPIFNAEELASTLRRTLGHE
ncbi:MAG: thioredoxin domain-containing protein, partial [Terriglobales bacterium]